MNLMCAFIGFRSFVGAKPLSVLVQSRFHIDELPRSFALLERAPHGRSTGCATPTHLHLLCNREKNSQGLLKSLCGAELKLTRQQSLTKTALVIVTRVHSLESIFTSFPLSTSSSSPSVPPHTRTSAICNVCAPHRDCQPYQRRTRRRGAPPLPPHHYERDAKSRHD